MNANESRGLVNGELERIARATEKQHCSMCELYENREQQLRGVIEKMRERHIRQEYRIDEAMRWKNWYLAAVLVIIVVIGGMAAKP